MTSGGYFFAFGLLAAAHFRKLFLSGFQVLIISPTFYKQLLGLLGAKMFLKFFVLRVWLCIFKAKEYKYKQLLGT
jgi:hypothetical protein